MRPEDIVRALDYSNKNVVVVGGTSGINKGVAESFARAGANVAVASRSDQKVAATLESLKSAGADVLGFTADVRNQEDVSAGLGMVYQKWGSIDVLVSGAAGNFPALANKMSANAFKSIVDIDLLGTFHVLQAAYPFLSQPGASIINISAPQAFLAMIGQSHVCAAKAGVDMITKSLAMEWGDVGIRINSVVPGPIDDTEGMQRLAPTMELKEKARQSVPMQRLGDTDDIGNACLFLGSALAGYITGAIIPVDGGWSLAGASTVSSTLGGLLKGIS